MTTKLENIRIVKKEFSFALTTEDFATKAKEIAALTDELAEASATFESAKARYKAKESECEAQIATRVRAIRDKREMREVECEQVHDYARNMVYWRLNDTVLGDRAMEASERQPSLIPAPGSVNKKAADGV